MALDRDLACGYITVVIKSRGCPPPASERSEREMGLIEKRVFSKAGFLFSLAPWGVLGLTLIIRPG